VTTPSAIQQILDGQEWAALNYDEGPFFQTKRFDRYTDVIDGTLRRCIQQLLTTLHSVARWNQGFLVFFAHAGLGKVLVPGGFGVTIFLLLSGFLIS
jgi:hypothetical protein